MFLYYQLWSRKNNTKQGEVNTQTPFSQNQQELLSAPWSLPPMLLKILFCWCHKLPNEEFTVNMFLFWWKHMHMNVNLKYVSKFYFTFLLLTVLSTHRREISLQNVADIKKLKAVGICTIKGIQMTTRRALCNVKGLSEAKVDKIKEAANKLVVSQSLSWEFELRPASPKCRATFLLADFPLHHQNNFENYSACYSTALYFILHNSHTNAVVLFTPNPREWG